MPVRALAGRPNRNVTKPLPRTSRVRGYSTPPPINGWNARDSLAAMKDGDAIELINWFPKESWVEVRKGYDSYATGLGSGNNVESLMAWNGASSSKLFGACNTSVFDVSAAGAVGAADLTGLTSARWQHTMFSISSGHYLYMVNGSDAPRYYDGSTWTSASLSGSGLTVTNLIHVNVFKKRLFFVEKASMNAWYLDVESVSGTLTKLDIGSQADKGGYLMAMGTWTRDGGSGIDDLAVFLTSEGQAVIYQGVDPSTGDSNAWSLVGTFNMGAPIGRRCMIKVGADLIVITEEGFGKLSTMLAAAETSTRAQMSDKISFAVGEAVSSYRGNFGWQPVFYPAGNMIFVNIPNGAFSYQFVSNSTTGAWCKFTGMNAQCWEIYGNALYFGGGAGVVYLADSGLDDNGANISTSAKTGFSYFGDRARLKRFALCRPNFTVDGTISVAMRVNVDFEDGFPDNTPTFTPDDGADWDVEDWDDAFWADAGRITKDWQSVEGIGTCASIAFQTTSQNGSIMWNATDWRYEPAESAGYI